MLRGRAQAVLYVVICFEGSGRGYKKVGINVAIAVALVRWHCMHTYLFQTFQW